MFRRSPKMSLAEQAPLLHALRVQTSAYGTTIPIIFGTQRLAGFLLDYQDFKAIPHVTTTPTGGKGGPKSTTQKTISYTYQSAVDIGLCEGVVQGLYNVWDTKGKLRLTRVTETFTVPGGGGTRVVANSGANYFDDFGVARTDAYSVNATDYGDSPRTYAGNYGTKMAKVGGAPAAGQYQHNGTGTYTFAAADAGKTINITYVFATPNSITNGQPLTNYTFTLFRGFRDSTQTPWGYMTTAHPGHDLAYRGLAHVASPTMDLGSGGTLPNLTFEIGGLNLWGGGVIDADPKDIVTEVLTNQFFGLGEAAGYLGDLTQFSKYCVANNMFLSMVLQEQRSVADILDEICTATNSAAVWSEGKLKIIPYGDTTAVANGVVYSPQTTPINDLNDDDFLYSDGEAPVRVSRSSYTEAYNSVSIEWLNRDNDYNPEIIEDQDQAHIERYGLRKKEPVQMHSITTKKAAQAAVNALLKRSVSIRNSYTFKLSWRYCLAEPMDLYTVTDANLGLDKFPVRITAIEESEDGEIAVEAEEFPFGTAHATLYPKQDSNPYSPQAMADPGATTVVILYPCPYRISGDPFTLLLAGYGGPDWGGATVYLSTDDASYKPVARITAPATVGVIKTSNLPAIGGTGGTNAHERVDTVNSLILDTSLSKSVWKSGTQADADNLRTLCIHQSGGWLSYKTATLTGTDEYTLSYLRRGLLSSGTIAQLNIGERVIRVDDAVVQYQLDPSLLGKKLYFKFASFNSQGLQEQSLANVTSLPLTLASEGSKPDTEGLNFIEHMGTADGGGNRFDYRLMASPSYTIASGDKLCYDHWIDPGVGLGSSPATANDLRVGVDGHLTSAPVVLRGTCVDQDGYAILDQNPNALGQWYRRQHDLTSQAGKVLDRVAVVLELDHTGVASRYRHLVKHVEIRNGNTLKIALHDGGPVNVGGYAIDGTTGGSSGYSDVVTQYRHTFARLGADPSNDAMPKLGSIPPSITGGFTWTTTTTSITISWTGVAIYRVDQWATVIPDGSVAVTGLTANTTYYFYPYYDEDLKILRFVIGNAGSSAFGAIANTAQTTVAWQKQWAQNHVPLNDGGVAIATPAAGTGGGGGGGGGTGHCPEYSQYVLDNVIAGEVTQGMLLDCIENWERLAKRPVAKAPLISVAHCFELVAENGCSGVFSAETPVTLPDGRVVKPMTARGVPIYSDKGWSHVCRIIDRGPMEVSHIYLNGGVFAAGKRMGERLYTHNPGVLK